MEIDKPVLYSFIAGVVVYSLTGLSLIALSIYYLTASNPVLHLLVTKEIYLPVLALGIFIFLSSILGVIGSWRPMKYKRLITTLGWCQVIVIIYELILGLSIWMYTLTPKALFSSKWHNWSVENRALVQYKGQCCGLNNSTDFIVPMKQCHSNNHSSGCMTYLTQISNVEYVDIYTLLFVFIFLNFFVLLSLAVLSEVRGDVERYEKGLQKSGAR